MLLWSKQLCPTAFGGEIEHFAATTRGTLRLLPQTVDSRQQTVRRLHSLSMSMLPLDAVVDVAVDVPGNELIKLGFCQDPSEGDIGVTRPPSNAVNVATTATGKVARTRSDRGNNNYNSNVNSNSNNIDGKHRETMTATATAEAPNQKPLSKIQNGVREGEGVAGEGEVI